MSSASSDDQSHSSVVVGPPIAHTQIVINTPSPESSPRSPRFNLKRPSPLSADSLRQMHFLTIADCFTSAEKRSPISPLTSDLGSSPRSSISGRFMMYRGNNRGSTNSELTDSTDSKDMLSPGLMLSPAPFSPFSDIEADLADLPAGLSTLSSPSSVGSVSSRFSFDPTSPGFIGGQQARFFLNVPAEELMRARSNSDSETTIQNSGSDTASQSSDTEPHYGGIKKRLLHRFLRSQDDTGDVANGAPSAVLPRL